MTKNTKCYSKYYSKHKHLTHKIAIDIRNLILKLLIFETNPTMHIQFKHQ